MDKNSKTFNLHHQYQLYLIRVGLEEGDMHPVQRTETKRAFFGACGQLLMLFRDDLTQFDDDDAVELMQSMIDQTQDFWNEQK